MFGGGSSDAYNISGNSQQGNIPAVGVDHFGGGRGMMMPYLDMLGIPGGSDHILTTGPENMDQGLAGQDFSPFGALMMMNPHGHSASSAAALAQFAAAQGSHHQHFFEGLSRNYLAGASSHIPQQFQDHQLQQDPLLGYHPASINGVITNHPASINGIITNPVAAATTAVGRKRTAPKSGSNVADKRTAAAAAAAFAAAVGGPTVLLPTGKRMGIANMAAAVGIPSTIQAGVFGAANLQQTISSAAATAAGEGVGIAASDNKLVSTTSGYSSMSAKDRRKERNKVLARKTRVKKKAEFQQLKDQVSELRDENHTLKDLILKTFPDAEKAKQIFGIDVHTMIRTSTVGDLANDDGVVGDDGKNRGGNDDDSDNCGDEEEDEEEEGTTERGDSPLHSDTSSSVSTGGRSTSPPPSQSSSLNEAAIGDDDPETHPSDISVYNIKKETDVLLPIY